MMRLALTPAPQEGADWFLVASWLPIYEQLGLAPGALPGVRVPKRGGAARPWPRLVHRSHLPVLGVEAPPARVYSFSISNPLRPHQVALRDFIQRRRGTLAADEMRVGKTPAIMYSHEPEAGILAVFAPAAARLVWHEWAARRFGACGTVWDGGECSLCERLGVQVGSRPSFRAAEGMTPTTVAVAEHPYAVFFNYTIGRVWSEAFDLLRPIGTLVLDEAHLAGMQQKRNFSVEALRRFATVAYRIVAATGSPVLNRPAGLYSLLDLLGPQAWGSYRDFIVRYADARPGPHGWTARGLSREDELNKRLEAVMLRRRWIDIAESLPPIERAVELVPLSEAQVDEVEVLAAEIRRMAASSQTLVGHLERLRRLFALEKAKRAVELALTFVNSGYSVIVWTWHREVAERIAAQLRNRTAITFGPIHGVQGVDDREAMLNDVANCARPRVLVATMAALGTAVNLSWATHQVFAELDWSPPTILQAEMRPYDGRHPVSSTYLVADVDADRRLADAIVTKSEIASRLGLAPGVGTIASTLASTFGIEEDNGTLSELAERLLADVV